MMLRALRWLRRRRAPAGTAFLWTDKSRVRIIGQITLGDGEPDKFEWHASE